jgi:ubiquinol-cytochrome c reductase iron-sulfur subunit
VANASKWLLAKRRKRGYQARQAARSHRRRVCLSGFVKRSKDVMAAVDLSEEPAVQAEQGGVRRRDFINIAAVSFAGVGGVALVYPLITQMSPSADVLALAQIDVDIAAIQPGQAIKTMWRKQPIFIRNLTPAEQAAANAVDASGLRDPQTLAERTKEGHTNWLITLGVCTHLGCVPLGAAEGENRGEYGGYFCPCHGSHYDTAARVRKGPAPRNLEVPEYEFRTPTSVRIG